MEDVVVFKRTQDDWNGNYTVVGDKRVRDLVEVSFVELQESYRVCVWGSDDDGMEFETADENEAWDTFVEVIGEDQVSREQLEELEFVPA